MSPDVAMGLTLDLELHMNRLHTIPTPPPYKDPPVPPVGDPPIQDPPPEPDQPPQQPPQQPPT